MHNIARTGSNLSVSGGTPTLQTDKLNKRRDYELASSSWNQSHHSYDIASQQPTISHCEYTQKRIRVDRHGAHYTHSIRYVDESVSLSGPPTFNHRESLDSSRLRDPNEYGRCSTFDTISTDSNIAATSGYIPLIDGFLGPPSIQVCEHSDSNCALNQNKQAAVLQPTAGLTHHGNTESNRHDCDLVCYGTLDCIDQVQLNWSSNISQDAIRWDGSGRLCISCGYTVDLSRRGADILRTLVDEAAASFDFELIASKPVNTSTREPRRCGQQSLPTFAVSVVVYGSRQAADAVGDWLDSAELYFQVPIHCSRNVPYCNPHAMTNTTGCVIMTQEFSKAGEDLQLDDTKLDTKRIQLKPTTMRSYREATQPIFITSKLHSHQLQALTFMQGREMGWDLDNRRDTNDLWQSELDRFGRRKYNQTLTNESRFKPPVEFRGGILADEMGLGKTCTMLSLIAADLESFGSWQDSSGGPECPTLIVVPLPLLQVWEKQIDEHFLPDSLVWNTYYGSATKLDVTFNSCDIVITTYNTVSKQWKCLKQVTAVGTKPPLFATQWRRIVLDEAHVIKNKGTDVARAVSALEGDRRWCITGTPIQNRSMDIYSLLRFLKVYPYDDFKVFESTFVEPWMVYADESALEKLQLLVSTITIRRPRSVILLPDREEVFCPVMFNADELQIYQKARAGAFQSIDAAFSNDGHGAGALYLNALQRINDMRYICNHGTQPRRAKQRHQSRATDDENALIDRELKLMFTESSDGICQNCGYDLLEDQEEENETLKISCRVRSDAGLSICKHCGTETGIPRTASPFTPSSSLDPRLDSPCGNGNVPVSSKIQSLVYEVEKVSTEDKCVVFSYWTSTLKVIGHALTNAGISFLLYDGSMTRIKRDTILRSFSSNSNIRVILVSITCGGQGLDLTVANHAFLVEPQWNPKLEEQAMARVHRQGQLKPVRLVRLIVKDTWEEKIITLQERKKLLADLIIDNKQVAKGDEGRKQLTWLRDLVS